MTMVTPAPNDMLVNPAANLHAPATRTGLDDVKAIPAALRSEWIKLSTVRSTQALLLLNLVAGMLVSWAIATFVTDERLLMAETAFFWTVVVAIVVAVGGVLLFTSEVQHGTLAAVLTAQPARWVTALAKSVMAIVLGLGMGVTGIVAGVAGTLLAGLELGDTTTTVSTAGWGLLYTSLAALLGLGVGMIVRHSAVAVSGLLVWGFLIEGLLDLFLPARVSRFLPFLAGDRLVAFDAADLEPAAMAVALSRTEGALVFGAYAVLALVVGTILLYRRDVH